MTLKISKAMSEEVSDEVEILIFGKTYSFTIPEKHSKELKESLQQVQDIVDDEIEKYSKQFPNDTREDILSYVLAIMSIILVRIKLEKEQEKEDLLKRVQKEINDITASIEKVNES